MLSPRPPGARVPQTYGRQYHYFYHFIYIGKVGKDEKQRIYLKCSVLIFFFIDANMQILPQNHKLSLTALSISIFHFWGKICIFAYFPFIIIVLLLLLLLLLFYRQKRNYMCVYNKTERRE